MMATSTELEFQQAIKDLQEINDQLFYDELKKKMAQHLQQLEDGYAKAEGSMENVRFKLERFEDEFHRITQEASSQMRTAVANIEQEVPSLFENQLSVIGDIYVSFSDLADEQTKIIQDSEKVWRELSDTVINRQKENHSAIQTELQGHSLEQQQSLKAFFEEVSLVQAQQFNHFTTQINGLTEAMGRQHQEIMERFEEVGALMEGSSEVMQLQLKKELSDRDSVWKQQKAELELVKQRQETHQAANKKWLVGLVVLESVLLAAVAGLYLL